ncbi:MAG: hypothetical protein DRQ99_29965, partial [Candidatus Parabeggiatoa sp. nov. 3]
MTTIRLTTYQQLQPFIENGQVIGWHWCRHEIENYLLEPLIVQSAFPNIDGAHYQIQLRTAAYHIRFYEAARWIIGIAKRSLPPHYDLQTRPCEFNKKEIAIFKDCSEKSTYTWLQDSMGYFYSRTSKIFFPELISADYHSFKDQFNQDFCQEIEKVLLWFSGKDLLAAMNAWCLDNC